jgi:multimeric flavodoxin WrbA
MNVLVINGSPNRNGNTLNIANSILKGLETNNHFCKVIHLYDLKINNCLACKNAASIHLKKDCTHSDDFTNILLPEIRNADLLIFATPVYMGHVTGIMKTMLDRWYTFILENFKIRDLENKKFISVVTSGAPSIAFKNVSEYLKNWLGEGFFKMKNIAVIHEGDFVGESGKCDKIDLLEKYEAFGKTIT